MAEFDELTSGGAEKPAPRGCRKWMLTINNPAEKGLGHEEIKARLAKLKGSVYWAMADEVGASTHTYHTHVFLCKPGQILFSTLKILFPPANLQPCHGSPQDCRNYLLKSGKWADTEKADTTVEGTFEESGPCPEEKQGQRKDLENLYEMVKGGMSNFQIIDEDPHYLTRIKDMDRLREMLRFEEFRAKERDISVEYWFGATGTGKTSGILARHGYEDTYRITDYDHPWDDYTGQDVVVFEEFHSQVEMSKMLIWLDRYPLHLPSRYNNKVACFTKAYITSNVNLYGQYAQIRKDKPEVWNAFQRRIGKVVEFGRNSPPEERPVKDDSAWMQLSLDDEKNLPFSQAIE